MTRAAAGISALLGSVVALAACGTLSPSASPHESSTQPPSQAVELPAVVCVPAPTPFESNGFDLTGAWAGNDGGIYYLRQIESVVWWNGMSGRDGSPFNLGRDWNNVARGVITGHKLDLEGADVPRGASEGNGHLVLRIQGDGSGNIEIVKEIDEWGDGDTFGSNVWSPCQPVQVADYLGTYGGTVREYAEILAVESCDRLAEVKNTVTSTMNTQDAASPEFRASLGYSKAISDRELELNC